MRSKCRRGLVALFAVFALGAVGATAAQATEGPYYALKGRMAEGAKAEITTAAKGNQILKFGSVVITCTKLTLKKGGELEGVKAGNGGKSSETVEYSGCLVRGDGEPCNVEPITTKPLVGTLGYSEANRKGKVYEIFSPKEKSEFAELKFVGAGCEITGGKVKVKTGDNGIIAEVLNSKGEAVGVGVHEAEEGTGQVSFPPEAIKSLWVESKGTLAEQRDGLEFDAAAFTIGGTSAIELAAKENWGVYTQ